MHTRLIALRDVTDTDVQSWHDLAEKAAEPNVYLDPRFLVPARDRGDEAARNVTDLALGRDRHQVGGGRLPLGAAVAGVAA